MSKEISITAIITRNALVQSIIETFGELAYPASTTVRVLNDLAGREVNTMASFKRDFEKTLSQEAIRAVCAAVPAAKDFAEKRGASDFLLKCLKSLLRDSKEMGDCEAVRLEETMVSVAKYIRADATTIESIKSIIAMATDPDEVKRAAPELIQMNMTRVKLINGLFASLRPGENDWQIYNAIYTLTHHGVDELHAMEKAISACFPEREVGDIIRRAAGVIDTVAPEQIYGLPASNLKVLVEGARGEGDDNRSFAAVPEHWINNLAMYLGMDWAVLTKLIDDAPSVPELLAPQYRVLNPKQKIAAVTAFSQHGLLGLMGFKYMLDNKALWQHGQEDAVAKLCLQAASGVGQVALPSVTLPTPGSTNLPSDPNMQVRFDQWLFWHLVALRWNVANNANPPAMHFGKSIGEMIDCIENETLRSTLQLYYNMSNNPSNLGGVGGLSLGTHFNF